MTPSYLQACQEAIAERGKFLVTLFCREHGVRVGGMRDSAYGPVLVTSRAYPPDAQRVSDKVTVRDRGGDQRRVKGIVGDDGYLFEHPGRPPRPAVWCSGCGRCEIDPDDLLRVFEEARRSGAAKHVVDLREALR